MTCNSMTYTIHRRDADVKFNQVIQNIKINQTDIQELKNSTHEIKKNEYTVSTLDYIRQKTGLLSVYREMSAAQTLAENFLCTVDGG